MRVHEFFKPLLLIVGLSLLATACAGTGEPSSADHEPMTLFEVHHDGRIHIFYDRKLYADFLQLGETPFRLTRIGAGPHGETVVFGLTKQDKKMKRPIPAIALFDGKLKAPENFYGEMVREGRIYVFDNYAQMQTVRSLGEPTYRYTQIGAGPRGETVVFVLTKANKKHRPDALIARFKAMHADS